MLPLCKAAELQDAVGLRIIQKITAHLIAQRHALKFFMQLPPVVCLQLSILYTLLCPILVPPADMVLRMLEVNKFVAYTFFNKNTTSVLRDYRLLVLGMIR